MNVEYCSPSPSDPKIQNKNNTILTSELNEQDSETI